MKIARTQMPEKAEVSSITSEECSDDIESIRSFASRFQAREERKGINAILRIEQNCNHMVCLQEKMLGKMDERSYSR
ncbi:MAG TPA: hypothetical protein PKK68_10855 [Methanothrix soehngenii]|nr:hypothetical protein [Methanothrix soehngenii]